MRAIRPLCSARQLRLDVSMSREQSSIRKLFLQLRKAPLISFPQVGQPLAISDKHGVYIIYSPRGAILHVGRTLRGKKGLRQRINNHLHGASSFTIQFLKGKGSKLRENYKFSF